MQTLKREYTRFLFMAVLGFVFCLTLSISAVAQDPMNSDTRIDPDKDQTNPLQEMQDARGLSSGDDLRSLSDAPVPEYEEGTPQSLRRYIYESATVATLSHLYWSLGMMDYEDKEHIDKYLMINECEIYGRFYGQEFEWKSIRDATAEFIRKNKDEFPTRFELVIPVRLEGYDARRKAFRIVDEDQVRAARRFELVAKNFSSIICWYKAKEIPGYPKGLIVELSRPFSMTYVPAPPDRAMQFVKEKDAIFQTYVSQGKTKQALANLRTAYIVMQLKIFGQRGLTRGRHALKFVQAMGVLEGFEVYGDARRRNLFYSKSYLKTHNRLKESEKLRTEFEILRKKSKEGEGVFY